MYKGVTGMTLTETERLLSGLLRVAGVGKQAGLYAIIATDTEDRQIEMMEFLMDRLDEKTQTFSVTDAEVIAKAKSLNHEMDWM